MIPDAVRLHNVEKLQNFELENLDGTDATRVVAIPVNSQYQCAKLKVDLRWVSL